MALHQATAGHRRRPGTELEQRGGKHHPAPHRTPMPDLVADIRRRPAPPPLPKISVPVTVVVAAGATA